MAAGHPGRASRIMAIISKLLHSIAATFGCLVLLAGLAAGEPAQEPPPPAAGFRIAIHCSLKVLQLWHKDELVREYPIDCGKGGVGKQRGGDHKTPVGDYVISWMASRNSAKGHRIMENKSWCSENKFYHGTTGPPLEKLWTNSYGGDQATVLSINYPNPREQRMGHTGSCIHIHADKHLVEGALKKSYGCIHMFPADAIELYEMVDVGTPVKILP